MVFDGESQAAVDAVHRLHASANTTDVAEAQAAQERIEQFMKKLFTAIPVYKLLGGKDDSA